MNTQNLPQTLTPIHKTPFEKSFPQETSQIMMSLMLAEESEIAELEKQMADIFEFKVAQKRLTCFVQVPAEKRLLLLIITLSSSLGAISIYMHSLWHMWQTAGKPETFTIHDFIMYGFADGFPTQQAMSDFWDKQKVKTDNGPDNLLDYTHIYKEQVSAV